METAIATVQKLDPALAYAEFRKQIEAAKADNANAVFIYEDPKGNKAARSHIHGLRLIKGRIEARRKEVKAEALEYGRAVDAFAKSLTGEVEEMIAVHEIPLKEIEEREAARVAAHEAALAAIVTEQLPSDSAGLRAELARVEAIETGEDWQEFRPRAVTAKADQIERLNNLLADAEQAEKQAAELERLRKAEEERIQKERDELIAREAREKAEAEAKAREEAAAKAAAEREAAIKAEAERKEREAREAREKAEREKAEAEQRAERAAKEERERIEREAKAKAEAEATEKARREADKANRARVIGEAVAALEDYCGDSAGAVVGAIVDGLVPHVSIRF